MLRKRATTSNFKKIMALVLALAMAFGVTGLTPTSTAAANEMMVTFASFDGADGDGLPLGGDYQNVNEASGYDYQNGNGYENGYVNGDNGDNGYLNGGRVPLQPKRTRHKSRSGNHAPQLHGSCTIRTFCVGYR